ncbi:MAG TPA: hypothetical protein VHB97_24435 [Polyangia bacterium]|jgi:multidrug resistance efflux pump|nr:hypothetical protein [Polyangia bacterium]
MATMRWGALALAAGMLLTAGCDKSKAALASTQQQLAAALAERDSYKQQLDAARAQLDQAQTQLALIKAAAALSPPPAGAAAPGGTDGKSVKDATGTGAPAAAPTKD